MANETLVVSASGGLAFSDPEYGKSGSVSPWWEVGNESGAFTVGCISENGKPKTCQTTVTQGAVTVVNKTGAAVKVVYNTARADESTADDDISTRAGDSGGGGSYYTRVPSWYKYERSYWKRLRRWGVYHVQHDYCTASSDYCKRADFRGPCAYHDLCYQRYNRTWRTVRTYVRNLHCQKPFLRNLIGNCKASEMGRKLTTRCYSRAKRMYYVAIWAAGTQY